MDSSRFDLLLCSAAIAQQYERQLCSEVGSSATMNSGSQANARAAADSLPFSTTKLMRVTVIVVFWIEPHSLKKRVNTLSSLLFADTTTDVKGFAYHVRDCHSRA
jgi:hypothetical protein